MVIFKTDCYMLIFSFPIRPRQLDLLTTLDHSEDHLQVPIAFSTSTLRKAGNKFGTFANIIKVWILFGFQYELRIYLYRKS